MAVPPVSAPYEQTVGQVAKFLAAGSDDSAGDPAKVAQAILAVVAMDAPPARLLLGSDALSVATASAAAQAASDTAFAELTRSTDHDDFNAAELARVTALTGAGKSPVEVVTRFLEEVVNHGDAALIDELWASDMEWHGGSLGEFYSRDEWKALSAGVAQAFADMHLTVRDIVAEGEKVAVRFTNGGRHVGPFLGAEGTGKRAEWLGIGIYTVRDGQIVEAWFGEDMLGLLQQVGAVTLPGA
jgi:predicted ester cyclase